MATHDELAAGIAPFVTPEIQAEHGLSPGVAAALTTGVAGLLAALIEPWLIAKLARSAPNRVMGVALAVVALDSLAFALAPHVLVLATALLLFGVASGVACAYAESALVAAARERAGGEARAMSLWMLAGTAGDVAAPALVVLAGSFWRGAFFVAAALALALAAFCWRNVPREPLEPVDAADARPLRARDALANRPLLVAIVAATACTLLDEIVLGFGALWLGERFGLDTDARTLVLGCFTLATLLGAAAVARLSTLVSTPSLLAFGAGACGLCHAALLFAPSPGFAALLLGASGFFAAWHYPLALALAYRAAGDRPLLAASGLALFGPIEMLAPFAVALVAEGAGATAALALLLLQPVIVLHAALSSRSALTAIARHRFDPGGMPAAERQQEENRIPGQDHEGPEDVRER